MLSGLFVQVARADATFPNVMLGTWAETAEQCAAKDKTNIVIEPTKYRDGGGGCAVRLLRRRCAGAKAMHSVIDAARSRRLIDPA